MIPINGYDREEHDGDVNAKNISLVKSTATLYAVVNTGAAGIGQSLVTVLNPVSIAGNVTIDSGNIAVTSAPTIYAVVNTAAAGIGQSLVTVLNPVSIAGNVTIDSGTISVNSNTAWSDPNSYIGLATVDIGSAPTLTVDATGQGDVPITLAGEAVVLGAGSAAIGKLAANSGVDIGDVDVTSNTAWSDPNTYIGLATVDIGSAPTLTVDATGQGDVPITLAGEAVVLGAGSAAIGKLAANSGVDIGDVDVTSIAAGDNNIGNVDIASEIPVGTKYVGLATVDVGKSERYSYAYTSGPTVNWIVKGSAGFVHAIHVGAAVASSIIEVSDHATDGDGNVILYQAGDTIGPAVYPLNMTMGTGITLDITNQTHVTVVYK